MVLGLDDWMWFNTKHWLGRQLLKLYGGSLQKALSAIFPETSGLTEEIYSSKPRMWWQSEDNQRKFLTDFAQSHNITLLDQWYAHTTQHIIQFKGTSLLFVNTHTYAKITNRSNPKLMVLGKSLLSLYGGSLVAVLAHFYPNHVWQEWNFRSTTKGFWTNSKNHRLFLDNYAKKNEFKSMSDWYNVSVRDIIKAKGKEIKIRLAFCFFALFSNWRF